MFLETRILTEALLEKFDMSEHAEYCIMLSIEQSRDHVTDKKLITVLLREKT